MSFASLNALTLGLLVIACSDHQAAGDRLRLELAELYPEQIVAISFENNPPLDPPTLFIDLRPVMSPDEQLRFLCDQVAPKMRSVDAGIDATVSYGWHLDDC